ncbi:cation:proton antiporter [Microbacterium sp. bgisy203]|uniref:cation:proton antiporter n=1 Tax=Microbacterium sp. bgisy203 TaxID=3413799 RepID=UPI003D741F36
MEALVWLIAGIAAIAASTVLARWLGVAGPLILVAIGIVASLFLPKISVPAELILVGILPPLLYSAAVRLPAVEFRRDALPITGLAVLLVVITSLALGTLFFFAIPGLGFPLAVALGAILSPTDAVATGIAKRLGIAPRVITMLEGESLLNDATALVLLRSTVAAAALGFSFWGTVGQFVWGVIVAIAIGAVVGLLLLRLRRWITDPAANTAVSFIVPFVAYLPTEHLGGSGLVAAVAAGIVTSQGATRWLTPEQRLSDQVNWRTVELLLEGAVFLIMGLELRDIVSTNATDHFGLGRPLALALAAIGIVLAVRTLYVSGLVALLSRRARNQQRERLEAISERIDEIEATGTLRVREHEGGARAQRRARRATMADTPLDSERRERRMAGFRRRVARGMNDLDYYQASPIGWKHGAIIVWAGMRGVVTLAAAQTITVEDTPQRDLLVLIAFLVALISLLVQGLTLPVLIRWLKIPASVDDSAAAAAERARLEDELHEAARARLEAGDIAKADGTPFDPDLLRAIGERLTAPPPESRELTMADMRTLRIRMIEVQRQRLVELTRTGSYSTEALREELAQLDAEQISLQLRNDEE